MVKKVVKRKVSKKKVAKKKPVSRGRDVDKMLVDNFVALQKVMTHLSVKFEDLTKQISELLKLFEDSSRIIVKNEMAKKKEDRGDRQILDTMVSILDQNKVIAKGLTLMYEHMLDKDVEKPEMFKGASSFPPSEKRPIAKEDPFSFPEQSPEIEPKPFSMNRQNVR